jgi:putative ABC transport system ATP-binding protein
LEIAMSDTVLVRLSGLCKGFTKGKERISIFDGLNLIIPSGDFVAVMGPSGSGKTTLLNLLGGIDRLDAGEIEIAGGRIDKLSEGELSRWRAAHIGFIFQFYNLMPVLSAFENVELPLMLTRLTRHERKERVAMVLDMVNMADRMSHYPSELSGGQQQRVAIARALITDPTLIVADEPTGDLDRNSAADVLAMLQRLNDKLGKTIIMVTHDAHAAGAAKALVHLEKGELIDGTTR